MTEGDQGRFLETIELTQRRFGEVDEAFDWRRAHTAYFTRRHEFSADMELYCERFRLVEVLKRQ